MRMLVSGSCQGRDALPPALYSRSLLTCGGRQVARPEGLAHRDTGAAPGGSHTLPPPRQQGEPGTEESPARRSESCPQPRRDCPGRGAGMSRQATPPRSRAVPLAMGRVRSLWQEQARGALVSSQHRQPQPGSSLTAPVPGKNDTKVVPVKLGHLKCGFTQGFCTYQMSKYSTI